MKKWVNPAFNCEVCAVGGLKTISHKTAIGSGTRAGPQTLDRMESFSEIHYSAYTG